MTKRKKKEETLFNINMFSYDEPEKEEKYLKTLKGPCIVTVIINKKKRKRLKGKLTGDTYPGILSDRLELEQKNRMLYIPIYKIESIIRKYKSF